MQGVELKACPQTVVEKMKRKGILCSVDGAARNIMKIKPPMYFNRENCDEFIQALEKALG